MSSKVASVMGIIIGVLILIMIIMIFTHYTNDTNKDDSKNEHSIDNVLKKQNVDNSLNDAANK